MPWIMTYLVALLPPVPRIALMHAPRYEFRMARDGVSPPLELLDQLAGALHRGDLLDQLHVALGLRVAKLVAQPRFDLIAAHRRDQLITAHPDTPVDLPDRERDAVLAEGAVPRDRVLVVRVDERSVQVEEDGGARRVGGHGPS